MSADGGGKLQWAEAFAFSVAVHAVAVYLMFDVISGLRWTGEDTAEPELLVQTIELDAATLAALTQEELPPTDLAAVDTDTLPPVPDLTEEPPPETVEPEPLDPEPVEPEPVEPEVVEPEAVEPEPLDPVTPEEPPVVAEAETAEPETIEAAEPELVPEVPQPAQTETIAAAEVAPEVLAPLPSTAGEVAPAALSPLRPRNAETALAPVALAPVTPAAPTSTGTAPAAVATAAPATVAAAAPVADTTIAPVRPGVSNLGTVSSDLAMLRPTRPATAQTQAPPPRPAPAAAPLTPQQEAIRTLLGRIRGELSETCLVAFPRLGAEGEPELVMLAANDTAIRDYAQTVLTDFTPPPSQRAVLVDQRQCEALDLVRTSPYYPAFPLSVVLDRASITSGEELTGQILNGGRLYLSLLLIDDNGVVQELGSYLSFNAQGARFSVPMRRAGPARDTSQILMVIGTDLRPATVDSMNGQLASDFFAALRAEVGEGVPLVIMPFDVR